MFFTSNLISLAKELLNSAAEKNLKIVTAESCTGGLLSALFTEIAGSSKIFERGFVTYSNQAKIDLLSVKESTLKNYGAVSQKTAAEMAKGALKNSQANIAISITGVAGAEEKSGLVYMAIATHNRSIVEYKFQFSGDRFEIRKASITAAMQILQNQINQCKN